MIRKIILKKFPLKMDKESRPHLSQKQKQDMADIFHSIFNKPLNKERKKDIILNKIEVLNY